MMPHTRKIPVDSAEPLLAGTLALMTFYADKPSMAAIQKIGRNLQTLQQHPQISAELSVVCRRLATYWLTLGCEVERADAHTACRFAAASAALQ
ncbi:MAG: hypothetical protein RBR52_12270 [Thiomonas sp.]|uniref:hypothetical protein n=1 Tax=Thiomonas sp. TaxID=2047785 RepID=UPI002A36ED45|nr:hypothetical protein [Thiomonas sp.]MDY0331251.1 hypothetical protein [Thiomonas sp.]